MDFGTGHRNTIRPQIPVVWDWRINILVYAVCMHIHLSWYMYISIHMYIYIIIYDCICRYIIVYIELYNYI